MKATNRDRSGTTVSEATARGVVKRDSAGTFYEEYEWSDIVWNGADFVLPGANRGFRQLLSLAPNYTPTLPDFSTLHPGLTETRVRGRTARALYWEKIRSISILSSVRPPQSRERVS